MINAYATIRIPVKDGADVDSRFQVILKSALIQMAGGASFRDLDQDTREALSWIYTAED